MMKRFSSASLTFIIYHACLFFQTFASIPSQTNITWSGCVDPKTGFSVVEKKKSTYICITVSNLGDWSKELKYARWSFRPIADEYSHFRISNSYRDLVLNYDDQPFGEEVSVHVASQQALSYIRMYYNNDGGKIYPYLTAILDVVDGEVIGIGWDNACMFCDSDRCEENTYDFSGKLANVGNEQDKGCYYTRKECEKLEKEGSKSCDLNIYFVWTGTDKEGRPLHSSGSRWSAFPPANIPKINLERFENIL